MASNVVVLLNGGKRQTIKTTPTMPLKEIVKLVCDKQGYTDVENYGLKQNKTTLDLSLSIRFANLAPGAKLELIRVTTPKAHREVTIALQMEDGGRIVEKFLSTTTLWEILLHFENTSQDRSLNLTRRTAPASVPQSKKVWKKLGGKLNNKHFYQQPVCILLNKEYGTVPLLKSTSLQSAGITSGNILLRVLFRHTELSLNDILGEIDNPIQSSTEINENNPEKSGQPTVPPVILPVSTSTMEQIESTNTQVNSIEETNPTNSIESTEETSVQVNSIESTEETNMQVNSVEISGSLPPGESKSEIPSLQSQETDEMDIDTKSPDVHDFTAKSQEDQEPIEKVDITRVEQTFEAQTSSITNAYESVGHFDRDIKVFNPPPENMTLTQMDLPDSFYELTSSELQFLLAMQDSKRKADENAGFKTRAMREQEEKARERKYPKTIIRVRFPDNFQVQMTFLSKETVGELYEFVKETLRTPQRSFCLFTSPPKKILSEMSLSLYQAGLSPASVVNFSWTDKLSDSGHFLSDEYLKLRTDIPHQIVDNVTSNIVPEQTSSINNEGGHVLSEPSRRQNIEESGQGQHSSSNKSSSKVPKWLKFGNKK
uniref:Tether containing UBX domain for GLUT4 n=1 Tax=Anthurium amnicola TaxID=1678845 RepID=A0A1D1XF21_9ARAE